MASCCTDVLELEFQWTIKKFKLHLKCAEKEAGHKFIINSSTFSIKDNNNSTDWHLKLQIYGPEHGDAGFMGLYTVLEGASDALPIWSLQDFYLIDSSGRKIKFRTTSMNKFTARSDAWGFSRFYEISKLLENKHLYLQNDQLVIVCRMSVIGQPSVTTITGPPVALNDQSNLFQDYGKLFLNEKFSDVAFTLDDEERIPAHRTILMARSSVFADMFEDRVNDMVDDDVAIDDIEPEIFKELLHYVYSNEVSDLEGKAMSLMCAAEEYGLEKLSDICLEYYHNTITVENAADTLEMAERYGNQKLIEYLRNFIELHVQESNAVALPAVNIN